MASESSDAPEITFGPSATETVLGDLGFAVDDNGVIVDGTGEPVTPAFGEPPVTLGEVAGFVKDETGGISVVSDDFTILVEYVKRFEVEDQAHEPSAGGTNDAE